VFFATAARKKPEKRRLSFATAMSKRPARWAVGPSYVQPLSVTVARMLSSSLPPQPARSSTAAAIASVAHRATRRRIGALGRVRAWFPCTSRSE
jgi:hypothetical protein